MNARPVYQRINRTTLRALFAALAFISFEVHADSLCYLTASQKSGTNNVVRMFKGRSCPKEYRKITSSVLGPSVSVQGADGDQGPAGEVGPQGATGAPGEKGPQGAAGLQGEVGPSGVPGQKGLSGEKGAPGATGDAGALGPQGDPGPQGVKGSNGSEGAKGITGPNGSDGLSGFHFIGSTGTSTVISNDNVADYWSVGDVDGPATSKGNTLTEVSTLLGSPCLRLELTLFVSSPPGPNKSWIANVGLTLPNNLGGAMNVCEITGGAQSCSGTRQAVTQFPGTTALRMGIIPTGSPTPVRASWNVRCVAQ